MTISSSTTVAVALFLRCPMGAASVNGDDLEQKPVGALVMPITVVVVVVVVVVVSRSLCIILFA